MGREVYYLAQNNHLGTPHAQTILGFICRTQAESGLLNQTINTETERCRGRGGWLFFNFFSAQKWRFFRLRGGEFGLF